MTPRDKLLEELFFELIQYNTPHGTEATCYPIIESIVGPLSNHIDSDGNIHIHIPGEHDDICFMSHLDAACRTYQKIPVKVSAAGIATKGKTAVPGVLGADDKSGAAIMLRMLVDEYPGHYMFFAGEERGCIGSRAFVKRTEATFDKNYGWKQAVSLDRYGTSEVIYRQRGSDTASKTYADALAAQLGLKSSSGGLFTDSAVFDGIVPECVNVSVGYKGHHSDRESQDLYFLSRIWRKLVATEWTELPIYRDPDAPVVAVKPPYRPVSPVCARPKPPLALADDSSVAKVSQDEWEAWADRFWNTEERSHRTVDNPFEGMNAPEAIQFYEENLTRFDWTDEQKDEVIHFYENMRCVG